VEAHLPQPVALEKYPMQEQRLVCMMEQLSALLERTSIHLPQLLVRIVLLVPLVMHVRVVLLHQLPVLLAKS